MFHEKVESSGTLRREKLLISLPSLSVLFLAEVPAASVRCAAPFLFPIHKDFILAASGAVGSTKESTFGTCEEIQIYLQ
jgi:hypothetical protein